MRTDRRASRTAGLSASKRLEDALSTGEAVRASKPCTALEASVRTNAAPLQPPRLHRVVPSASPEHARYLDQLVGRWTGEGRGLWDAPSPFRYLEEVTFSSTGKPFLHYLQRTNGLADNRSLHTETGYVRATGEGNVEMLIVQPTGFSEIYAGTLRPAEMALTLINFSRTPTALPVTELQRQIFFDGDTLSYLVRLAMNGEPLADHLSGQLHRSPVEG